MPRLIPIGSAWCNLIDKVFCAFPSSALSRFTDFWHHIRNVRLPRGSVNANAQGIYIADLQNTLAREFLETDCTHFWLVNDDQIYPVETVLQLLDHKKDIIGPLALRKTPPYAPLVYEKTDTDIYPDHLLKTGVSGLIGNLGALGGGGMLVTRRVFERLTDPWWDTRMIMYEGISVQQSEDMVFCRKAVDAGFEIWCDLDIYVRHRTMVDVMPHRDPATGEWATMIINRHAAMAVPAASKEPAVMEMLCP